MSQTRKPVVSVGAAVAMLVGAASFGKRNLQMPGDPRYQPEVLKPYLGYDQWAGWLIIVSWFWMETLASLGVMPKAAARSLTKRNLHRLLRKITTTQMDAVERQTRHDIRALLQLIREHLPACLHPWLHLAATSYDIIDTAYALQLRWAFCDATWPAAVEVDKQWRGLIRKYANILQMFRTHLQDALPGTVGCWLANLHHRFVDATRRARVEVRLAPGKFSGAVGTKASQVGLGVPKDAESLVMKFLGLPVAAVSTQIVPPEQRARAYFEIALMSGAMANLGEDVRILQSSLCGELSSASAGSSAMSHKLANPIAAENDAGMHISVLAELQKILGTLVSDLQRDLRGSNVMRSFSAVLVFTHQQIITTARLLNSLGVNEERCTENFWRSGRVVVAELLHLELGRQGLPNAHTFVNQRVVPPAMAQGVTLDVVISDLLKVGTDVPPELQEAWDNLPLSVLEMIQRPDQYLGNAVAIARNEARNKLAA